MRRVRAFLLMKPTTSRAAVGLAFVVLFAWRASAQDKKQFRYTVQPGATLNLVSDYGAVKIRAAQAGQIVVAATRASRKVEVDGLQNGNRIELRSRYSEKVSDAEGGVDYDVQVPADTHVIVRTASGPVQVQAVAGDIVVDTDNGNVEIRNANGHVKVRTVGGAITLENLHDGFIDATSVGGQVSMHEVSGKSVTVNTTSGPITYAGDCAGNGIYSFTSHSGTIDVSLPTSASIEVTARSVNGSVENDFPFNAPTHSTMALVQGKSLAGSSNSGAASVSIRTFSGRIRVKKQ